MPSAQCQPVLFFSTHCDTHPDCQLSICQTTLLPSAQPRPTSAWDRLHPDVLARALPRNHDTLRKTSCLPARPGQARPGQARPSQARQGQAGQPEPQPESALYIFLPLSHRPRPRPETSPQGQAGQPEPEPESALSALSASLLACWLAGLLLKVLPVPRPPSSKAISIYVLAPALPRNHDTLRKTSCCSHRPGRAQATACHRRPSRTRPPCWLASPSL